MDQAMDVLPLSTASYLADTQHLSNAQHGAYLLILISMWRAKGSLPADDKTMAAIVKLSVAKWKKISGPVRALLIEESGLITQKRLRSEYQTRTEIVSKNRENGSAGGRRKSLKSKDTNLATASLSLDEQNTAIPSLTFFPEDKLEVEKTRKKGSALSDEWQIGREEMDYGIKLGLSTTQVRGFAEDMKLWAKANANRAVGRKADWSATFCGWLRRESAKRPSGNNMRPRHNGVSFMDIANGTVKLFGDDDGERSQH